MVLSKHMPWLFFSQTKYLTIICNSFLQAQKAYEASVTFEAVYGLGLCDSHILLPLSNTEMDELQQIHKYLI